MLWALLAMYLFGSSGAAERAAYIDRVKAFVKTDVQDSARRSDLLAVLDGAACTISEQTASRKRIVKDLLKVSEGHEARTADIRPLLERYRAEAAAYQERMIKRRFELIGKMTREEWATVFPVEGPPAVNTVQ